MAADWAALGRFLRGQGDEVTLTWQELEDIVGGMPASSIRHQAFWGGDRPHTRAWRAAGFELAARRPGVSVTFRRKGRTAPPAQPPDLRLPVGVRQGKAPIPVSGRVLLIACGKAKLSRPAAARDLYTSLRFRKARQLADRSGTPWYVLSAQHGLVAPDDWLAPYDRFLGETPTRYRRAWAEWVAARLELELGSLRGVTVDVHAGREYVAPLEAPLAMRGAVVQAPLAGLTLGQWLQWYNDRASETRVDGAQAYDGDIEPWTRLLKDPAETVAPADVPQLARSRMDGPGLYAWFADAQGAAELGAGLGCALEPGLVYIGQTGATKWPSGTPSGSTLLSRIRRQHLGGNRRSSTLRRTLGAVLDEAQGRCVPRAELTAWMFAHMRVTPAVVDDADVIADLERRVVQALNPPLNLDHTLPSPVRRRLRELRSAADRVE